MTPPVESLTYCSAKPRSWAARAILCARKKMYDLMSRSIHLEDMESVLDVGVSADRECEFSNYFEYRYPFPERVTALSNQDASWMMVQFPGMKFVRGDARHLPFADGSFDLVYSSAVIEHVGSRDAQGQYIGELMRVARKHVYITTPNRWFPVEMHSGWPFIHWLPPPVFRLILRSIGKTELAEEANLNLLSKRDLLKLCVDKLGPNKIHVGAMRVGGFSSNLLLHVEMAE